MSRRRTKSRSMRSFASGSNPSGNVYSSALIFWKVKYSVLPRKGGELARNWKRMQPSAQKSDLEKAGRQRRRIVTGEMRWEGLTTPKHPH